MREHIRKIPNYLHGKYFQFLILIGNLNYLSAFWWGISIGKNCKFLGKTNFRKYPNSIFRIGDNCTFNSINGATVLYNRSCSIMTNHSKYNASLVIEDNCGFSGTVIAAFRSIYIGKNVMCGANTFIFDGDFHLMILV